MLEEAADRADDLHAVGDARDAGSKPTGIADEQVHLHARLRGEVERPGDVLVLEGVHLELDEPGRGGGVLLGLALDLRQERGLQ